MTRSPAAAYTDRFDAFISYSHSHDTAIAQALQADLQTFARPWYRPRVLRIFRDDSNLAASPELWPEIERALEASSWFILMACPESAASHWVRQEVAWWLDNRPAARILIAWTDGDLKWNDEEMDFDWTITDALPRQLSKAFSHEPRWINLSTLRGTKPTATTTSSVPRLGDIVAEFAAPIRDVPKDALVGEHHRQRRRLRRTVFTVVATLLALTLLAGSAGVVALQQRNTALQQSRIAVARLLAATSDSLLGTRLDLAQLLAAEAYRMNKDWRTYSSLFHAVTSSPHLRKYLPAEAPVVSLAGSLDGSTAVAGTVDGNVVRWSVANGNRTVLTRLPHPVQSVAVSADGHTVAATDGSVVQAWSKGAEVPGLPALRSVEGDKEYDGTGHRISVSPSGRYIAAASSSSGHVRDLVVVRDLVDRQTYTFTPGVQVGDLAFPDDAEIVTLSPSGQWERRSLPSLTRSILNDQSFMGARGFAPTLSANGLFYTFTNGSKDLPIWRTTTAQPKETEPELTGLSHGTSPQTIALAPDGAKAAVVDGGVVYVSGTSLNADDHSGQVALPGNNTTIPDGLEFLGDGGHLLMASGESLVLWDLSQLTRIGEHSAITVPWGCNACEPPQTAVSPDGKVIAVVSSRGDTAGAHSLSGGDFSETVSSDEEGTFVYELLGWVAESDLVVLAHVSDGALEFRRAVPGFPMVRSWPASTDGFVPTELTIDHRGVVERNNRDEARIRDLRTGGIDRTLNLKPGEHPPTPSSGGRTYEGAIFTSYPDEHDNDHVEAVSLMSGRSHEVGSGPVAAASLGPGGLVIQRSNGLLEVWDRDGTTLLSSMMQDSSFVQDAQGTLPVSAGSFVAQQRADRSIVVTDFMMKETLGSFELPEPSSSVLTSLDFSPDGTSLVTVSEGGSSSGDDGLLVRWDLSPERWLAAACSSAGRDLTVEEWRRFVGTDPPRDLACGRPIDP
jgi:WD40 repeat protein